MLASVVSPEIWLLLTTTRVVVSQQREVFVFQNTDIKDVTWDAAACTRENQAETYQLAYLLLDTYSGDQRSIRVEPGGGYLGILSVLKMIAEKNWREKRGLRGSNVES